MGIGSSIWHSCVATFQPNWFQLYSSTFFSPQNLLFPQSDNLGADAYLPLPELHDGGVLEPARSLTPTTVRCNSWSTADTLVSTANPQLDSPLPLGRQACSVCALSASASCCCCDEKFCRRHIYQCTECQISFCGEYFDLHNADGHWSDSDTTAALVDSSGRRFDGDCPLIASSPPESATKQTSPSSASNINSLSTATCNSTQDKTLHLLPFQGLFSIFAAIPVEATR